MRTEYQRKVSELKALECSGCAGTGITYFSKLTCSECEGTGFKKGFSEDPIKTFTFFNDTYADEFHEFECYNVDRSEHPDFIQNGTAHSVAECYQQVREYLGNDDFAIKVNITERSII